MQHFRAPAKRACWNLRIGLFSCDPEADTFRVGTVGCFKRKARQHTLVQGISPADREHDRSREIDNDPELVADMTLTLTLTLML